MGASSSSPIQPLRRSGTASASPYFVLIIRPPKSLVILYSDTQIQSIISRRLRKEFKSSSGKLMSDNSYEFSINLSSDYAQDLKNAQFFCRVLVDLNAHGWKFVISSDLCRSDPRSTLFFRRYSRNLVDAASTFVGVVASQEKIRLVDFPEQLSKSLTSLLENWPVVADNVRIVCQETRTDNVEGRNRRFIELLQSEDKKLLLLKITLNIFSHLNENGYNFYGTINVDGNSDLILFEKSGNAPPRPTPVFFSIDLVENNILRVINGPSLLFYSSLLRPVFMSAISQLWQDGMRHASSPEPGNFDLYCLNGNPFTSGSRIDVGRPDDSSQLNEALRARRFLSALFEILHENGWRLLGSIQLDRSNGGTSTFVFCSTPSAFSVMSSSNGIHRNSWSLALMSTSSIYLVNAFSMCRGSFLKVKEDITSIVSRRWPLGLGQGAQHGFRHFELNGKPWHALPSEISHRPKCVYFQKRAKSNEDLHARALICAILAVMEARGHELICTAAITSKMHSGSNESAHKSDCDTWFWVEKEGDNSNNDLVTSILGRQNSWPVLSWDGTYVPPSQSNAGRPQLLMPSAPNMAGSSGQEPTPAVSTAADDDGVDPSPPPYPIDAPPPPYWKIKKKISSVYSFR